MIGYCPQQDTLFDLLSVEETIRYFANLRNIKVSETELAILRDLKPYMKTPAGKLSGGNKRKLQVAIATLGKPLVVLLDEPSAGMDPKARKFLWERIADLK